MPQYNGVEINLPSKENVERFKEQEEDKIENVLTMDWISDEVPMGFCQLFPCEQPATILLAWRHHKTNIIQN